MDEKLQRQADRLASLALKLTSLPRETEWVEFKENFFSPEDIGEYISALSNGATLNQQDKGYLLWGVQDSDHVIVGTSFDPASARSGQEELKPWLIRNLRPQVHFEFHKFTVDGKDVVLLEVDATHTGPVRFKEYEWIRVGSYKKKLRDYPDYSRRLWRVFDRAPFESRVAAGQLSADEAVDLLDYPSYFRLLQRRLPSNITGILEGLNSDALIQAAEGGDEWEVTNLGAVLFARDISDFPALERKALRIVQYDGDNRIKTLREQVGVKGYAAGFAGAVQFLNNMLPAREEIGSAMREVVRMYPELAVRELLANALIHQDFSQTGNGPMVEIFDRRIEITSPGLPLVEPARFVDAPPKSRNEKMAGMMRRARICEERGTGWDKIVSETELHQLPAPLVQLPPGGSTRVVLFGPKSFAAMDKAERLRAVYLHACLRYVEHKTLTNTSLRARFNLPVGNTSQVSRLIADAVDELYIAPVDPEAAKRLMEYVPAWAADASASRSRI